MLEVLDGLLLIYRRVSDRLPWWKQEMGVVVVEGITMQILIVFTELLWRG